MNNPGWVDLQVNGQSGVDFSSPELTADSFLHAAQAVLDSGTDIFLPTVITGKMELYQRNLPLIASAVERGGLKRHIPGIHLEGPFLTPEPGYIGCHNPAWVLPPDPAVFDRLFELSEGTIRLLTVAAAKESGDLIRRAVSRGVAVSLGHHNASPEMLKSAARVGATGLTHLGNGVPNFLPRHRNTVFAGLAEDALTAMAVTDGHHLPPEVIKCFLRCKTPGRFIVTSDGSPAAGLPPGRYHILGNDAILDGTGRLYNPDKQCLVGSAATMSRAMAFLAGLELLTENELIMVGRGNALKFINCNGE